MSKVKKIEDRTRWFIEEYSRLSEAKRLPSNVELARIMGINSKSAVTNILKGDQNIQPDHWEKFKAHFQLENAPGSSNKSERDPTSSELLAGLIEGFKAIADTMKSIESKMAQEKTQAKIIEKSDDLANNLQEALAALDKVSLAQNLSIDRILNEFSEVHNKLDSLPGANRKTG